MSFAILNVLKKGWKILYSVLNVFYFWQSFEMGEMGWVTRRSSI